jgi:hypothetical protein
MANGVAVAVLTALAVGCGTDSDGSTPTRDGADAGSGDPAGVQDCDWVCQQTEGAPDQCMCVRRYHFEYDCIEGPPDETQVVVEQCPLRACCIVSTLDQSAYDQVAELCICNDRTAEECPGYVEQLIADGDVVRAVNACPSG